MRAAVDDSDAAEAEAFRATLLLNDANSDADDDDDDDDDEQREGRDDADSRRLDGTVALIDRPVAEDGCGGRAIAVRERLCTAAAGEEGVGGERGGGGGR